jgi:hypothetical protein
VTGKRVAKTSLLAVSDINNTLATSEVDQTKSDSHGILNSGNDEHDDYSNEPGDSEDELNNGNEYPDDDDDEQ